MTKTFCDICGEEITDWSKASEFKLKKRVYSFHESWWERLTVHPKCWAALCDKFNKKEAMKPTISDCKITAAVPDNECVKCTHFLICSCLMGGMDLEPCENYEMKSYERKET